MSCRRATHRLLTPPRRRGVVVAGMTTPTKKELTQHLKRYANPEKVGAANAAETVRIVGEVAAAYGIRIDLPRIDLPRKERRPGLKARIKEQLERGASWDSIAETENLSPSRARRLRTEFEESDEDSS